MGKKNKYGKKGGEGGGGEAQQQEQRQQPAAEGQQAGATGQQQQPRQQQKESQPQQGPEQKTGQGGRAAKPQQQRKTEAGSWGGQQQQRPQQQQQQRPQPHQGPSSTTGAVPKTQQSQQQRGPPPQQLQTRQQQQWVSPPQQQPPQQQQGVRPPQQQQWTQQQPPQQQQGVRPPQQQQSRLPPQQQQQQPRSHQQYRQPPQQQQQQYRPQQQQRPQQVSSASSFSSFTASPSFTKSSSGIERGTIGRPGTVDINYLELNLDQMPNVAYHYDVTITPDRPKKYIRKAFEQFNRQFFKDIPMAYDGKKSVYTVQKLPSNKCEMEVEIDDTGNRKIKFTVCVKETDAMEIDLNSLRCYSSERVFDKPMRALQCLEVVMANPCHGRGVRAGRAFFTKPEQKYDLSGGYEMWTGLFQAAILGDRPFLNVDISHKSFPTDSPILQYVQDNIRNANLNEAISARSLSDLKQFIKNVNIVYEPPKCFGSFPRNYKVIDVSSLGASSLKFTKEDGETLSVADYFQSRGYKLKHPHLNCLQVGSTVKINYVPMELCTIMSGQALNRKDDPRQVQQMIRYSATSTNERKDKIMRMLQYFQHNSDPKIQRFGINIGGSFITAPMRLLDSPKMEYFSNETIMPRNGSWRINPNTKFLIAKQLTSGYKWAVCYSKKGQMNYHTVYTLAQKLADGARKLNVSLAAKPDIKAFETIDNELLELKNGKYDLVVVLIPAYGTSYAEIKQSAELRHGVLTQCIKEGTVIRRLDEQLVLNLLLKINAKLNGTNHRISERNPIPLKNVMFLGADVTHPSPDQQQIPSVVGVAASHDVNGACYNMQYRLQGSAIENIEDMDSIFTHHLRVYFTHQGRYPDHVIYYRDGVSDGQFPIVKQNELRGIRAACTRMRISPKLTCIIVVKRHHTRFFPKTPGDARFNKYNNVDPGTVVDRVITHPNEVQFFMVSHQSIQGTAKPTRYNVIEDDAKLDINLLQMLTYNLCHLFPRCNRVVSYPAPAYLAHLVAARGRVYLDGATRFRELKDEYEKRTINPEFLGNNPMYFV